MDDESFRRRALDLLVFAPAGLLLTAVEELPNLIEKGRSRIEMPVRNARFLGKFAVTRAQRDLLDRLTTGRTMEPPTPAPAAPRPPPRAVPGEPEPPPVDGIIPGYDTLSASQVVRRLEGLGPDELRAVHRYEAATRQRRTILHRALQLLGVEQTPGAHGPAA